MARTRGASSQHEGRRRPTASVHRGDRGASSSAPVVGGNAPNVGGNAPNVGGVAPRIGGGDAGGFPGRPSDVSLLVSYDHHVALRLWEGEVRLFYNLLCLFCV